MKENKYLLGFYAISLNNFGNGNCSLELKLALVYNLQREIGFQDNFYILITFFLIIFLIGRRKTIATIDNNLKRHLISYVMMFVSLVFILVCRMCSMCVCWRVDFFNFSCFHYFASKHAIRAHFIYWMYCCI